MNKNLAKFMLIFLAVVFGLSGGFLGWTYISLPTNDILEENETVYISKNHSTQITLNENTSTSAGDVAVHFLELGNKYTGDCTYIKVGESIDILIDCGSRTSSIAYVKKYLDNYVVDGVLDYVIITHAHRDHYAGFATSTKMQSIFDLFYCNNIITFATTETGKKDTATYKNFERELNDAKGLDLENSTLDNKIEIKPNIYTALECVEKQNGASDIFVLDSENNIELQILKTKFYYDASENENNNSVCCMINQGNKNFLFTGDLEGESDKDGEHSLIALNTLPKVELLKAGHHGSKTSSSNEFLNAVLDPSNPAIICVCCCAGATEYTSAPENTFPTKEFIERISQYTTLVYVTTLCTDYKNGKFTSFNGNITIISSGTSALIVEGSNNETLLKDSKWFKENRYNMCYDNMAGSWK